MKKIIFAALLAIYRKSIIAISVYKDRYNVKMDTLRRGWYAL